MSNDHQTTTPEARTCPSCGAPLEREGDLLRCAEHGLFFRYGPRLLVHAPNTAAAETPLLPWQTVQERAVG
jgi:hypothetical protein